MGLCYVSRIMLLLLNVLLDIALTSAKCFISFSVTPWCRIRTRLTILAWRNSIAGSNNPPGLSCLEMSILVLQMCCILGRIIICSKTAGSYCVSEPIHIIRNSIVLILLQLAILIYVWILILCFHKIVYALNTSSACPWSRTSVGTICTRSWYFYVLVLTAWTLIILLLLLLRYFATIWSLIVICCGDSFIKLDVVQLDLPNILVLKIRLSGSFASLILDLYHRFVRMADFLVLLFNHSARTVLNVHDIVLRLVPQPI